MARFSNGWVKIHRAMINGDNYDSEEILLLVWLICNANYMDGKNKIKGKYGRLVLKRGELCLSINELINKFKMTSSVINTRLKRFQDEQIIEKRTSNFGTIVTILNYDKFQSNEDEEYETKYETNDKRIENGSETNDKRIENGSEHNKELKNLKKERTKELKNIYTVACSGPFIDLGTRWLKFALAEYPWRQKESKWTAEIFGAELEKVCKSIKSCPEDMSRLVDRLEKDEFWRKNAASPFGLLKKSKNGMKKIDNIIAALRTDHERRQASTTSLAELRKTSIYAEFLNPIDENNNNILELES